MTRLHLRTGFLLAAAATGGVGLLSGCNKAVGGKLGSALGRVGDSYLHQAGVPVDIGLEGVTTEMGGIVGEKIGQYLDASERRQAEAAARDSVGSGEVGPKSTRTWKSQTHSDVSGGSTVVGQTVGADGRECRTQRNYVNIKGKDVEQTETLCRDPRTGAWTTRAA